MPSSAWKELGSSTPKRPFLTQVLSAMVLLALSALFDRGAFCRHSVRFEFAAKTDFPSWLYLQIGAPKDQK